MEALTCFSLQTHHGDYASWPGKSQLFMNGDVLPTNIPGYTLLHQFATTSGYLLITDYDCPYEEATEFILLDSAFKIIDRRSVGAAYASYALEDITWSDAQHFTARFYGIQDRWHFAIRTGRVFWPMHRLAMTVSRA
jgi:hypothetical protein